MIARAVDLLREGRLVAFPTETVYGLGADATNASAICRVFAVKGRPATNPLICHVADESMAKRFAQGWPNAASALAKRFWPGPLTIVLPKVASIPNEATGGRQTVGLRAPNHPIALELLHAFGGPIAAPSANKSNHISPTTAQHVRDDLGDEVDLILDGGACEVGIESTVIDLSVVTPIILRPGGVSRAEIESVIGKVELFNGNVDAGESAASPGQHARHYAPTTPAIRIESNQHESILSERCGLMLLSGLPSPAIVIMPGDPREYAHEFYAALRELDGMQLNQIIIEMPPDSPEWSAVRDRIIRATTPA